MRLKAKEYLTYAGREWAPGQLLDAPRTHALELINHGHAEPFLLEDPSQRPLSEIVEGMRPPEVPPPPVLPDVPGVALTPEADLAVAAGQTGSIMVTITEPGISGTWTVEKEAIADWLTYTPDTPQATDGVIDWTAAANAGAARTGHLYINGKTFTLDQDGAVLATRSRKQNA